MTINSLDEESISLESSELEFIQKSYDQVQEIFERSCYDCHSNNTDIPIYGYMFPVNLYLQDHVSEGRESLNFSKWKSYSAKKRSTLAFEIVEEVEEDAMPPASYKLLHSKAIIDPETFQKIKRWQEEQERYYENSQK
ncbi:heme-binding domain-containing protein [Leptospira sp. GIMC2001]|uniref:heme-binding domain-containing protein n=1 Tax=Leptospira sp. GIMC2001 TaxID=1513297 RepID=UPI00234A197B|nr:heme-binding domain-containing protein [Leptospira sp. GIMC2001]WCL47868.1 heme-binding domain-containing protein [Leptospira sp. GIMC2001]